MIFVISITFYSLLIRLADFSSTHRDRSPWYFAWWSAITSHASFRSLDAIPPGPGASKWRAKKSNILASRKPIWSPSVVNRVKVTTAEPKSREDCEDWWGLLANDTEPDEAVTALHCFTLLAVVITCAVTINKAVCVIALSVCLSVCQSVSRIT